MGGVCARNANYSYKKRAAPLDFEEGFGKLKEVLRKRFTVICFVEATEKEILSCSG
jgi:hypothetical protein